MTEREGDEFIRDYLTWMKGSELNQDSLHLYNFGYERTLPFPSIALSPDNSMKFNLHTSGMQTPSRWSMVIIGEKYLARFKEIMTVVERIHEDTQALPFAIFLETENEQTFGNLSSMHVTPALVYENDICTRLM